MVLVFDKQFPVWTFHSLSKFTKHIDTTSTICKRNSNYSVTIKFYQQNFISNHKSNKNNYMWQLRCRMHCNLRLPMPRQSLSALITMPIARFKSDNLCITVLQCFTTDTLLMILTFDCDRPLTLEENPH